MMGEPEMTKPIVAFQWLRVNGRQQKQQNRNPQTDQRQQATTDEAKQNPRKLKKFFRRDSK
jgi:hypothetical protein